MCDGVKFQIKCNRVTAATVNVRLKDMPTVKNLGAPNDRMFLIHTYVRSVSNGFLHTKKNVSGLCGAVLRTIYLLRCLKGTLVVSKVFG